MPPRTVRPRHHCCPSQEPQKRSSWVAPAIRSPICPSLTNENRLACCWVPTRIVHCMEPARSAMTSR